MTIDDRIQILFSSDDKASGKRPIRDMEKLVEEVINDAHYRTVWMPCLPMEEEKTSSKEDQHTKDTVEEAAS